MIRAWWNLRTGSLTLKTGSLVRSRNRCRHPRCLCKADRKARQRTLLSGVMENVMSKRWLIALAVFATLSVTFIYARSRKNEQAARAASAPTETPRLVSGPGRVEPTSEEIKLGSELSGKLKSVNVEEGDTVHRGQVLAELQ